MSIKKTICFLWLTVSPVLTQLIYNNQYMVHHKHDRIGRSDKVKMIALSDDLMKDSYLKMRQIIDIRKEHEILSAFNVGIIIGKINEKYRYMIELYKDILHKFKQRTELVGPGINVLRVIHYIVNMELIHFLEVEIDRFVHVLEVSAKEDMISGNQLAAGALRMGPEIDEEEEIFEEAKEETEKSIAREQFLLKRLGTPNITTTKKRFINHWPVEETWSLEGTNIY